MPALATLVRVAGSRWRVEETFQSGKGLAGLDEHQLRLFTSWSRWVTLAMLARLAVRYEATMAVTSTSDAMPTPRRPQLMNCSPKPERYGV
jgi:SRSO17 transposase